MVLFSLFMGGLKASIYLLHKYKLESQFDSAIAQK